MTAVPLVDALPAAVTSAMLSMPRLFVFMIIVPWFSQTIFPRMLRVGIAFGLGAPVAAGIFPQLGSEPVPPDVVALVLKECVLGLLLGIIVAMPIWAIQAVGALADNQRGANAAQQVTPFSVADSSILGAALSQALIVTLAASGAFALIYELLLHTFHAWPVLQLAPDAGQFGFELASKRFGEFLQLAVLLSAPILAIILLVDFAFALMSVFAPQLQTYFASMPIKSLAAILVLAVYVPVLLSHGEGYFREVFRRESSMLEDRTR